MKWRVEGHTYPLGWNDLSCVAVLSRWLLLPWSAGHRSTLKNLRVLENYHYGM